MITLSIWEPSKGGAERKRMREALFFSLFYIVSSFRDW